MAQSWRSILLRGASLVKSGSHKQMPTFGLAPLPFKTTSRFFTDGARLFVGGISFNTTEDRLRDAFAAHGEVMDAKIIMDRETGRSRGFGFITYYKEEDADTALSKLNGHNLDGRVIRVDRASSRPARPMGGGGGYGAGDGSASGGGGFGGRSSFSGFSDPEPAADEDWGSLPSLNVDVHDANSSQN